MPKFTTKVLAAMLLEFFEGRSSRSLEMSYGRDHTVIYKKLEKAVDVIYPIAHLEFCSTRLRIERTWQLDEVYVSTPSGKRPLINIVSTIEGTNATMVLVLKLMKNSSDVEVLRAIRLAIKRAGQKPEQIELDPFGSHVSSRFRQIVQGRWRIGLSYKRKIGRMSQLYRAEGVNNLVSMRLRSGLHGNKSFMVQGLWIHIVFAHRRKDLNNLTPFEYARGYPYLDENGWEYLIHKAYPLLRKKFRRLDYI